MTHKDVARAIANAYNPPTGGNPNAPLCAITGPMA